MLGDAVAGVLFHFVLFGCEFAVTWSRLNLLWFCVFPNLCRHTAFSKDEYKVQNGGTKTVSMRNYNGHSVYMLLSPLKMLGRWIERKIDRQSNR